MFWNQETGPTMDISNLRTTLDPSATLPAATLAAGATGAPASSQAAGASGASAGSQAQATPGSQAAAVSPSALDKAVRKINQQLEQSSGVTLSAGLDTSGDHPGQVLVELSDKATQQTFFKYYVPATQVVQAAQNLGTPGGAPGALISAKA